MNEERTEPRIEPVPAPQAPQAPKLPPSVAVPASVEAASQQWNETKAKLQAELAASNDPQLQRVWNLFQFLEQSVMNSVISFLVNFFTNNLRTTVAGVVFVVGQFLAKYGLEIPQGWSDALFGSTSFLLFMLSDKSFSWRTVAGVVLMLASFFLNPLLGVAGMAASPLAVYTAQVLLQGIIATLLKDQPNLLKYSPLNTAQKAGLLFLMLLASCVPAPAQTERFAQATVRLDTVQSFRAAPTSGTAPEASNDTSLRRIRAADEQRRRFRQRSSQRAPLGAS